MQIPHGCLKRQSEYASLRGMLHLAFIHMDEPKISHAPEPDEEDLLPGTVPSSANVTPRPELLQLVDAVVNAAGEYTDLLRSGEAALPACSSPEQTLAALALALYMVGGKTLPHRLTVCITAAQASEREFPSNRGVFARDLLDEWMEWRHAAMAVKNRPLPEPLQPMYGDYCWISESNAPECYLERLACACATLCYATTLRSTDALVSRTKLLSPSLQQRPRVAEYEFVPSEPEELKVTMSSNVTLEVAIEEARHQRHVAIVLAASPDRIGGNFLVGGQHGMEEEICARSNFYFSLQEAARLAAAAGICEPSGQPVHIPPDGTVVSPGVQIFRDSANRGYSPLSMPVTLAAVLSISQLKRPCSQSSSARRSTNGRPASQGSSRSVSPRPCMIEYVQDIRKKFETVLQAANNVRAEVLVISDSCCGDSTDPLMLGHAFGCALQTSRGQLLEVILTGSFEFQMAVRKAVGSSTPKPGRGRGGFGNRRLPGEHGKPTSPRRPKRRDHGLQRSRGSPRDKVFDIMTY